jgi:three-Cys-motif partner protein
MSCQHLTSILLKRESAYRHGSPLIALETEPPFDSFIFIDKGADSLSRLRLQIEDSGHGNRDVRYIGGDANLKLQELCAKDWKGHRAVAFLDPFAMQVRWDTIRMIAETQSIDMWLLFPAMAVSRMLPRSGEIPESWQKKLSDSFGCDDWKAAFYYEEQTDLFGESSITKLEGFYTRLSQFITVRLKSVFPGVTRNSLILRNSVFRSANLLLVFCLCKS